MIKKSFCKLNWYKVSQINPTMQGSNMWHRDMKVNTEIEQGIRNMYDNADDIFNALIAQDLAIKNIDTNWKLIFRDNPTESRQKINEISQKIGRISAAITNPNQKAQALQAIVMSLSKLIPNQDYFSLAIKPRI